MVEHEGKRALGEIVAGFETEITSGPCSTRNDGPTTSVRNSRGACIADVIAPPLKVGNADERDANAEHIARCHPENISAIAKYVERLEAENARLRKEALDDLERRVSRQLDRLARIDAMSEKERHK